MSVSLKYLWKEELHYSHLSNFSKMRNGVYRRYQTVVHLVRTMKVLTDALQYQFNKLELIPPVSTFLLNEASNRNLTPSEKSILRNYAEEKYR